MAQRPPGPKNSTADPKALEAGLDLLKEFQPMLEILARKDLPLEELGPAILKRFPPEVLIPLRDRIKAVQAALPPKTSTGEGSTKG
ncbi:MAG: hypothetical protein L0170_17685 [Acidobacteria bacterium]|nr:hypothetical protein [Acidobacteriota bacterium]